MKTDRKLPDKTLDTLLSFCYYWNCEEEHYLKGRTEMDYTTLTTEAETLITNLRRKMASLMIADWDAFKTMEGRLEDLLAMAEDRFYRRVEKQQDAEAFEDIRVVEKF